MPKTRRTPPHLEAQVDKVQGSIVHSRQYNQSQLPPQQVIHRPQHTKNEILFRHHQHRRHHHQQQHHQQQQQHHQQHHDYQRSSYHPRYFITPPSGWPSNPHAGQSNYNDIVYNHDSSTGPPYSPIAQTSHPPPTYTAESYGNVRYMSIDSNTNDATHWNNDPGLRMIDPNLCPAYPLPTQPNEASASIDTRRHDQLSPWTTMNSSPIPILNKNDEDSYLPEHNNSSLDDQDPLAHPTSARPANGVDPRAFLGLPGYYGEKNSFGLFNCFGECTKGRVGYRGFARRANLLVHLRSCHEQDIRRGARLQSF